MTLLVPQHLSHHSYELLDPQSNPDLLVGICGVRISRLLFVLILSPSTGLVGLCRVEHAALFRLLMWDLSRVRIKAPACPRRVLMPCASGRTLQVELDWNRF